MSRYIDADHAEFRLQCCGTYHGVIAFDTVKAVLNKAPSIDIVFCKDCKWGKPYSDKQLECDALGLGGLKFPEDFCSHGKRE